MFRIIRKRNSGKTTMLLHAMCLPEYSDTFYVADRIKDAEYAYHKAIELELNLPRHRFLGVAELNQVHMRMRVVVDDLDLIENHAHYIRYLFDMCDIQLATYTI